MNDNIKLNISFLLNGLTDEELVEVAELIEGLRIRRIVRSNRTWVLKREQSKKHQIKMSY